MPKNVKKISAKERKKLTQFFGSVEPAVLMASLFGSYGTDYQRSDSDIDFALLFEKKPSLILMEGMKILKELIKDKSFPDALPFGKLMPLFIYPARSTVAWWRNCCTNTDPSPRG